MLEYEMQPLHKKTIRLSALARQIVSDFLNNGLDERFSLELEVQDEKARVCGDERLLTRAVANLIQNSVRHNPDGCRIQLLTGWHEGEGACRVVVADDGRGIAREELADLVELPYSAKRKRPRHNGHGLGLPMVARIARAHQGSLLLDSDTGKGFRAELVLPSATGAIATEAAETEAVAAE
jgi:signal transduction histidine kinase